MSNLLPSISKSCLRLFVVIYKHVNFVLLLMLMNNVWVVITSSELI